MNLTEIKIKIIEVENEVKKYQMQITVQTFSFGGWRSTEIKMPPYVLTEKKVISATHLKKNRQASI